MIVSYLSPTHNYTYVHWCSEDIAVNVGTIASGAEFSYTFKVVALKVGLQELVVGLESDKVELVSAEAEVNFEQVVVLLIA